MNGKQARDTFDHHHAGLVEGGRHQRNAPGRRACGKPPPRGPRLHPFGPGAGFAGTAPAEDQPVPPVRFHWRFLVVAGPEPEPVVFNFRPLLCIKLRQNLSTFPRVRKRFKTLCKRMAAGIIDVESVAVIARFFPGFE